MNTVQNKINEIEKRIDSLNIGQFKEELMSQLRVNFRLQTVVEENYLKLGNSRIGGWPDLPKSHSYPTRGNGYYNLILQLNFAELETNLKELPKQGILYIFYGDENSDDFKVIYTSELNNLEKKEPPSNFVNLNEEIETKCYKGLIPDFDIEHYFEGEILWKILKYDESVYKELTRTNSNYTTQILATTFDGTKSAYMAIAGFDTLMFESVGLYPRLNDVEYRDQLNNRLKDCEHKMKDPTYNKSYMVRRKEQLIEFDKNRGQYLQDYLKTMCIISIESLRELNWQWGDMGEINLYMISDDLINKKFEKSHIEISSS